MEYSQKVMDHFMNPRNVGKLENASGVGEVGNPTCGDIMHIEIEVKNDRIEDIKFRTFGCAAAIATSSMVTEMVKGKTLEEAEKITNRTVAEALDGLPPVKMHCSNLAADALHEAIVNYRQGGSALTSISKSCCRAETDSLCGKGQAIVLD
jgi:nitrogen fixation NifU-like protein